MERGADAEMERMSLELVMLTRRQRIAALEEEVYEHWRSRRLSGCRVALLLANTCVGVWGRLRS